tara:strand:- start:4601 stop:5191 length:591 start_codon:yes stop_codon:yes gene_type:complete
MIQRVTTFVIAILLLSACASIPKESYELNLMVSKRLESQRLYQERLINELIAEKLDNVSDYIQQDYLPTLLKKLKKLQLENGLDTTLTPEKVAAIANKAIAKYTEQAAALEALRRKLLTTSNDYYMLTIKANDKVTELLKSAVKVDEARTNLVNTLAAETKVNLDLDSISNKIDNTLKESGDISGAVETIINTLNP